MPTAIKADIWPRPNTEVVILVFSARGYTFTSNYLMCTMCRLKIVSNYKVINVLHKNGIYIRHAQLDNGYDGTICVQMNYINGIVKPSINHALHNCYNTIYSFILVYHTFPKASFLCIRWTGALFHLYFPFILFAIVIYLFFSGYIILLLLIC